MAWMRRLLFILTLGGSLSLGAAAPSAMEYLDRGVVAVNVGTNRVFLSWRQLGTEPDTITFNIYRNGTKITATPISLTNYTDTAGSTTATYEVRPVIGGVEQAGGTATVWGQQYLTVNLQQPAGGTVPDYANPGMTLPFSYTANDASVGDLDGDGKYEIVLKWDPDNAKDNSQSGYTGDTIVDAYKLDGTRLWRIDYGVNIRAGAHYMDFMVYDFDGDGKAEMICRTAPGTKDSTGAYLRTGPAATDNDAADYRNTNGYVLSGPEYLTVFNGQTGVEMQTINYNPPRGTVDNWGDNYGNRVDRFLAGVAYLDGQHPSGIFARGYYPGQAGHGPGRTFVWAVDWRAGALSTRWTFDTATAGNNIYIGKGNHQLSVADVDGNGTDEIIYGALVLNANGMPRFAQTWGHGDALHVADIDPSNQGLEIWSPDEWSSPVVANGRPGVALRSANTGAVLWAKYDIAEDADVGRAMTADISAATPGNEVWATSGLGLYDAKGNVIGSIPSSVNFGVWWDGDLLRELLDKEMIDKWNVATNSAGRLLTAYTFGAQSCNGTKATPSLSGDILGDWREEVIWRHSDNQHLLIFTTTNASAYKFRTLMHDRQYREAIAWQNTGYNQPPHPSFFLGDGMTTPPAPNIVMVGGPVVTTPTRTVTPAVPTATRTATATATRTVTATSSATGTATRTATPSNTAVPPSLTATRTATGTLTATSSATPTASGTRSSTPSASATASGTRTGTLTASPSLTATRTHSGTTTATPTSSATATPSLTATRTASPTVTASPSHTVTLSSTRTSSPTSSTTPSPTATVSRTLTATRTVSPTPSSSPSATPTFLDTYTSTPTATPSFTVTRTSSPSPTETSTASPSLTATRTSSSSATPSSSTTRTATASASPTFSHTATATPSSTAQPSLTATTVPPTATPTTGQADLEVAQASVGPNPVTGARVGLYYLLKAPAGAGSGPLAASQPGATLRLSIYSRDFKRVMRWELREDWLLAGYHHLDWDLRDSNGVRVPNGTYFYEAALLSQGKVLSKRLATLVLAR